MKLVNWPLDKAGDLFLATPGLGDVIRRSIQGLTSVCNDLAQWTVRPESICEEFRKAGHAEVRKPADVINLPLEQVDRVVSWLDAKYKGIALVEGAGTGSWACSVFPRMSSP